MTKWVYRMGSWAIVGALLTTSTQGLSEGSRVAQLAEILGMDDGGGSASASLPTLVDELLAYTLRHHPGLSAERAQMAAREAGVSEAQALYQPELSLSVSLSRVATTASDVPGEARAQSGREGVFLRQNLWRGGRDQSQITIANHGLGNSRLTVSLKAKDIAYSVEDASLNFNQAALSELLAIRAAADAAELTLLSQRKFAAGQVGRIDVHQATLRESEAKAQAARAALVTQEAEFALRRAMAAPLDQKGSSATSADELLGRVMSQLKSRAWPLPHPVGALAPSQSMAPVLSIELARNAVENAAESTRLARRELWLPTLDFVASLTRDHTKGRADPAIPQFGGTSDREAVRARVSYGLELSWPLWSGVRSAKIERSAQEEVAAQERLREAETTFAIARDWTKVQLEARAQTLSPYLEAYRAAGRLYDAQRQLYAAGATTVFQVTEADNRRLQALRDWLEAAFQVKQIALKERYLREGYVATR